MLLQKLFKRASQAVLMAALIAFAAAPAMAQDSGGYEIPEECAQQGRLPPPHWTRELHGLVDDPHIITDTWQSTWRLEFPFPSGNVRNIGIKKNHYLSLMFNSGIRGTGGQLNMLDLGGDVVGMGTRPAIVSLSRCPGDFKPQKGNRKLCQRMAVGGLSSSFSWTRAPDEAHLRCLLLPNEVYFLNIAYVSTQSQDAQDPENLVSRCQPSHPDRPCGHAVQHTFRE